MGLSKPFWLIIGRKRKLSNLINPRARRLNLMQRQFIRAPSVTVFEYISSPTKLKKWFVSDASFPSRSGERYFLEWPSGKRCEGKVLSYAVGKKLAFEWSERTSVNFTLSRKDGGTVLKLDHRGSGGDKWWSDNFIGHCSGWAYFLMNLKSVMEYGKDLRSEHYGHSP